MELSPGWHRLQKRREEPPAGLPREGLPFPACLGSRTDPGNSRLDRGLTAVFGKLHPEAPQGGRVEAGMA